MPRVKLAILALAAAAALLVPAGAANAQGQGLNHRLANVPFRTVDKVSAAFAPERSSITVFYRCTSRRDGTVIVGPADNGGAAHIDVECDGRTRSLRFLVDPADLLVTATLDQRTAARAGFSVWE